LIPPLRVLLGVGVGSETSVLFANKPLEESFEMKTFAALVAAGVAASASAQSLDILVQPTGGGSWTIDATLSNPTGTIVAVISDLNFTMTGADIANFSYNSAFDSTFFGNATVTASATQVSFGGTNTLPPLNNAGGPDSSNPLHIATFDASSVSDLVVNGQFTGAYAGAPFPVVFFYQNANGSAGPVPYTVTIIPAPASAALLGLGGLAAIRRRR